MTHPEVYAPAEDTWLLLRTAEKECRDGERVLEIGCGSGAIAAVLRRQARVIATDINPNAVRSARDAGVEVVRTDLFSGICGTFDLVLFNPPYLPTTPDERMDDWFEYALDGGPDGCAVIAKFLSGIGRVLAPGGRGLLLISSLTGLPEVSMLIRQAGFTPEVI
ncbi:MAG: class I SAM-dependent methyltransferase, partial [Methanoregulaceae archaeon]|nr:class I SAM-dependent methyltransferase [Methanoregulaceae archaeon]